MFGLSKMQEYEKTSSGMAVLRAKCSALLIAKVFGAISPNNRRMVVVVIMATRLPT